MCRRGVGERLVAPIKQFGPPVMDVIGPMPHLAQQSLIDAAMPPNVLNYGKAEFLREVSDEVMDVAVDAFGRVASTSLATTRGWSVCGWHTA
jgi:hypothetical protein